MDHEQVDVTVRPSLASSSGPEQAGGQGGLGPRLEVSTDAFKKQAPHVGKCEYPRSGHMFPVEPVELCWGPAFAEDNAGVCKLAENGIDAPLAHLAVDKLGDLSATERLRCAREDSKDCSVRAGDDRTQRI